MGISKEVNKRHKNIKVKSGYSIESMLIFPCTFYESTIIEKTILCDLRKTYRYLPSVKFPGYKECLSIDAKDNILEKLKNILISNYNRSSIIGKILDYEYGK